MTPDRRSKLLAVSAFVLLTLIWGYNWIVLKIGLRYAAAFDFAALRTACATVCLFSMLIAARRPLRPPPLGPTILLGLVQTTCFIGLITWALVSGGVGKTSVLVFTMPFWTLLLGWPLLGERVRGPQWLAVGLALGGLILILEPWNLHATLRSKALAIAGGVAWSLSAVIAKRLQRRQRLDVLSLTAWQMLFGTVPLVLVAWLAPSSPPLRWEPGLVLALAYTGIVGMALAWLLWLYLLNRLPAGTASLNALAIPAIAVLFGWLQLGERPGVPELLGMLGIGLALALVSLPAIHTPGRANP